MDETRRVLFDAMLFAMEGEDPSKAIELQEKRGQNEVVRNCRLPKRVNSHCDISTEEMFDFMGIKIIESFDDLFYSVSLPEGWEIKPTDHSMWNKLFDSEGRERASFFYKASFYDRDAFINFNCRYKYSVDHTAPASSDYDVWKNSPLIGRVYDAGNVVFETETLDCKGLNYSKEEKLKEKLKEKLYKICEDYLKDFPDYSNPKAYW